MARPHNLRTSKKGTCLWEGCDKPAKSFDMCNQHYLQVYNYGFGVAALPDHCEVCGSTKNLHFDHDHSCCPDRPTCGWCLRGRLCGFCNIALGHVQDDPDILRKLADYVDVKRIDGSTVR